LMGLDQLLDLPLYRLKVERSRGLHRRVIDRREGQFRDRLLRGNEAPGFAAKEIILSFLKRRY
jgi:hypothetical protein